MWRAITEAKKRSLAYIALACLAVMLGLQAVVFAIGETMETLLTPW